MTTMTRTCSTCNMSLELDQFDGAKKNCDICSMLKRDVSRMCRSLEAKNNMNASTAELRRLEIGKLGLAHKIEVEQLTRAIEQSQEMLESNAHILSENKAQWDMMGQGVKHGFEVNQKQKDEIDQLKAEARRVLKVINNLEIHVEEQSVEIYNLEIRAEEQSVTIHNMEGIVETAEGLVSEATRLGKKNLDQFKVTESSMNKNIIELHKANKQYNTVNRALHIKIAQLTERCANKPAQQPTHEEHKDNDLKLENKRLGYEVKDLQQQLSELKKANKKSAKRRAQKDRKNEAIQPPAYEPEAPAYEHHRPSTPAEVMAECERLGL